LRLPLIGRVRAGRPGALVAGDASVTCWDFSPKKIMEDTGFTEYPVDYRPPILPRNPEVPRSFRPAIRQGAPGHTRPLRVSRERALGHTVPVRTTGYANYTNTYSVH